MEQLGRQRHAAARARSPGRPRSPRSSASSRATGDEVRVAGAGHSFAPLCATDGLLLDLSALTGVRRGRRRGAAPRPCWPARASPTSASRCAPPALGLANQGDVDTQAIAGAIATGTHGSGGVRQPRDDGAVGRGGAAERRPRRQDGADAGLALGMLGVLVSLELAVVPAYRLHERTWHCAYDDAERAVGGRRAGARNLEFFWLPLLDRCVFKRFAETDRRAVGRPAPAAAAAGHDRALPEARAGRLEPPHLPVGARRRGSSRWSTRCRRRPAFGDARRASATLMLHAPPRADVGGRVPRPGRRRPGAQPDAGRGRRHAQPPRGARRPVAAGFARRRGAAARGGRPPHWGKLRGIGDDRAGRRCYPRLDEFRARRARSIRAAGC